MTYIYYITPLQLWFLYLCIWFNNCEKITLGTRLIKPIKFKVRQRIIHYVVLDTSSFANI